MIADSIRQFCLSFPQAKENLQWGEDLCFKINGKIFAVLGLAAVPPSVCFKCTPENFSELVERDGIIPAPYVGRYKWVLVQRWDALRDEELQDLIRQSYEMVSAKGKSAAKSKGKPKSKIQKSRSSPARKKTRK